MRQLVLWGLLLGTFNLHAALSYVETDIACPIPTETDKYINVPLFHDLVHIAETNNITDLKTHEALQILHAGKSLQVYYELLAPYDPNKELLVMIPGGPGQTHTFIHSFQESIPGFAEFSEKYNIFVMDHRGIGCSRYFGPGEYPSESLLMRQAASDIELIRRSYGEDIKINVWGYSYGSVLAQTYALLFPKNLEKLFLGGAFSAASDFVHAMKTFEQRVLNAAPKMSEDYHFLKTYYPEYAHKLMKVAEGHMYNYTMFKRDLVKMAELVVEKLKNYDLVGADELLTYHGAFIMEWMMRSISCTELFPNELKDGMFPLFWESVSTCTEFKGKEDYFNYTEDLIHITAPTFIWGGEFDHVTTATGMRKMDKVLPNNYLYIDAHIAHGFDKPECFMEMMSTFFEKGNDSASLALIEEKSICVDAPEFEEEDFVEGSGTRISVLGL